MTENHGIIEALELEKSVAIKSAQLQSDMTIWSLLKSIAEGVVAIDEKSRILLVNPQIEKMLGYTFGELIGKPIEILIPHRFHRGHKESVDKFFKEPRIRPMGTGMDLYALHKDGREISTEISLSFLNTNIGQIGLAIISDITDRKRLEDQLRAQNEGLDMFATAVAHNLKTSINGIVGTCELLKHEDELKLSKEEQNQYFEILLDSGKKMSQVIEELLLFAKIGKEQIKLSPVDIDRVVNSVKQRLTTLVHQFEAKIEMPQTNTTAMGYSGWLEEILYNLISNAIKYGGNPPKVRIECTMNSDGDAVMVSIIDNGKGLTQEAIEAILNEKSPIRHKFVKGNGIGLIISSRIAEKIGARIEVISSIEGGSRFTLVLPAVTPN